MISSYQYQNISHHSIICALKWNNRESKQLLPQLSATQISSTTSNMILAEFRLIPCSWDGILTETYPFLTFDISRSVFSYLESRDFSFSFYPHAVLGKNSHQQKQQIQLEMIYPKVCSNIVSRTVLAIGSKNLCCVVKRGTGGKPPWTYPGIGDTQRLPTSQWPRNVVNCQTCCLPDQLGWQGDFLSQRFQKIHSSPNIPQTFLDICCLTS